MFFSSFIISVPNPQHFPLLGKKRGIGRVVQLIRGLCVGLWIYESDITFGLDLSAAGFHLDKIRLSPQRIRNKIRLLRHFCTFLSIPESYRSPV